MKRNPAKPDVYQKKFAADDTTLATALELDMTPARLRALLAAGHTRAPVVSLLIELAPMGNLSVIRAAQGVLKDPKGLDPLAVLGLNAVVAQPPATQTPIQRPYGTDIEDDTRFLQNTTLVDLELSLPLARDISFIERMRRSLLVQTAQAWCSYAIEAADDRVLSVLARAQASLNRYALDYPHMFLSRGFDILSSALQTLEEGAAGSRIDASSVRAVTVQDLQHILHRQNLQNIGLESARVVAANSALAP
jgi:hypothetical protein